VKGYPFEVKIAGKIDGVVLSDQMKNLDWKIRNAEFISKISEKLMNEVLDKLRLLIY